MTFLKLTKSLIQPSGFVLLLVFVIIALLLLLVFYFIDFIVSDARITQSHYLATKTYYLAEAGINEAIWKLTHDQNWYNSFITNPSWQATIARNGIFESNDSYQVLVKNLELAQAEITATSTINITNQISQRVIKTKVYRSLNPFLAEQISVYTKQDYTMSGATTNVNDSNVYSYDDVVLSFFSTLNVDYDVSALDNINKSFTSTINANALHSVNYPPPPAVIEMPQIDFDSADPNSYLNRANQVYTAQQFQSFLNNNSNAVLNGITYVQGNINVPRGVNLTINGVLVSDGNFKIGDNFMPFWKPPSNLIINATANEPAGLLSKKSVTFGGFTNSAAVNGLVYTGNTFRINNISFSLTLNGGVIAYDFEQVSLGQPLTVNFNSDIINNTVGNPAASPLINIEHWEEEY